MSDDFFNEFNDEETDLSKSEGNGKILKIVIIISAAVFLLFGCGCLAYVIFDTYLLFRNPAVVAPATATPTPRPEPVVTKKIDEKTFPDETFRKYVAEQFDLDGNGELECAEYEGVTEIHVNGLGIESLEGLYWFRYLEVLECRDNQLTSLDVSHNTRLVSLDCSNNPLSELDVSRCKRLETLVTDPDVEIIRP